MTQNDVLAQQFEEHRGHLRAVAYRMLGSASEADDAVQEAWLRLSRSDAGEIANLGGWLTTVVARVCLDLLRSHEARREEPLDTHVPDGIASHEDGIDPEQQALLADSVGLALLVVLDTLNPAERLAFVLHDLFDVPFEEIAPIVGRSPAAARQLASRARRRVRRQPPEDDEAPDTDLAAQRAVVDAFLAASRDGDFPALVAVLDPDVELRANEVAARAQAPRAARGAEAVAQQLLGRAKALRVALVGGAVGAVYAPGRRVVVAFAMTIVEGRIAAIEIISDPQRLSQLNPRILDD
jgi:RNA polymerase sigma-70 factor, ECF subfamily